MKKNNPIYFLLFILLVMGAFASMAQNNYGLKLMGGVAFVFGGVFLIELIQALTSEEKKDGFILAELTAMILFSVIFGCRVFNIYFPFIEWVFVAAGVCLLFFYIRKLFIRYSRLANKNQRLAILGFIFHLSIILFLLSMILSPFAIKQAEWIGMAGFVFLLVFIIGTLIKKFYLVDGNNVTALQMITGYRDHSIVLIILFLLFSLFTALNKANLLPGIYSDEYPRAYNEMVNSSASGKEKTAEGKSKHEDFMEQYQLLLKHINNKKK
jgi:hypothetical protein